MMCDELDIAFDRATVVMGRTDMTVDQGGSGGSDAIEPRRHGRTPDRGGGEARAAGDGVGALRRARRGTHRERRRDLSRGAIPRGTVTYGELIGGRRFDVALAGGNINSTTGVASVKPVQDLKLVGQSIPRYDIPGKVDASLEWAVDVKLPGMVHARNVRPPFAGGDARRHRRVIGARRARLHPGRERGQLRGRRVRARGAGDRGRGTARDPVGRSPLRPPSPPPTTSSTTCGARTACRARVDARRRRCRGTPTGRWRVPRPSSKPRNDIPFHGHTAIGPAHALADPSDGQMTIYTNDMKPYSHRTGIAEFLGMPAEQVRVIWMDGPQLYGRTAADDAGFEAAYLARELGRPVRVQWMRHEETAWDTKGPAFAIDLRGGLDADGNVVALDYQGRVRQLRAPRIQPGPHRANRAADGVPARAAVSGRRPAGPTTCTTSRTGARRRGRSASRWPSRRRSAPATCETPTDRRRPSPGSRSSTSWPRPRAPTRSSSGCASCAGRPTTTRPSAALDRSRWSRPPPRRTGGTRARHPGR